MWSPGPVLAVVVPAGYLQASSVPDTTGEKITTAEEGRKNIIDPTISLLNLSSNGTETETDIE